MPRTPHRQVKHPLSQQWRKALVLLPKLDARGSTIRKDVNEGRAGSKGVGPLLSQGQQLAENEEGEFPVPTADFHDVYWS
jgi:hypothetical protein